MNPATNSPISIEFLGAAGTVTGSKHLIKTPDLNILIDCGMFQGLKKLRLLNWEKPHVNPRSVDVILLTHGHLDHVGYLPRMVTAGFRGRILATRPTLDVAEIILNDSARIQEEEADRANRHGYSKHNPALPLYTSDDVRATVDLFHSQALNEWIDLSPNVKFRLRYNGHILGATFIELDIFGKRLVFSGDIGRKIDSLLRPPERPEQADIVVMESTYGDRLHDAGGEQMMVDIITRTSTREGTVIIPSFAVERTQSIMHLLWTLQKERKIPFVPIYLDSPMGSSVLELFQRHPQWHKLPVSDCKKMCEKIHTVSSMQETKSIAKDKNPKIIIAGSGMITGGRVLTYLQQQLGNENCSVVLVGYQAEGTRGRDLLEGKKTLKIYGEIYQVRAEVHSVGGLSAHADQAELIDWLGALEKPPKNLFLVHGEPGAASTLQQHIKKQLGWKSHIPELYETFSLNP